MGEVKELNESLLISSLCKYYKPMNYEEYMDMDYQDVTNAITVSGMPKELVDKIWIPKRKPFEIST